ncbi:MAG: LysR family transcriptional regulator [Alphaproteobacteria bacterium]|nr:MAG: LysR family transcriptional regulator [Alphaproteobacteria bacterium]
MDMGSLRIFANAVKLGSFAAVARQMDIDPSTVSRSITNLETELGFRLLQRTTRKLAPTEAGSVSFERIHGLLDDFDSASLEAQDLVNAPRGTMRIAACTSFGPRVLAPLLPRLMELYPDLSIELLLADHQIDIIKEEIDLAIRFGLKPKGDFVSVRLNPRRFHICASPGFIQQHGRPSRPETLAELDCIVFRIPGYPSAWKFRSDDGRVIVVPISGKLTTLHGSTMTASAVGGVGVAMLPDWLCGREIDDGSLIDLFPEHECTATEFDTASWLTYPNRQYLPLKVRKVIDFLQMEVGGHRQAARF